MNDNDRYNYFKVFVKNCKKEINKVYSTICYFSDQVEALKKCYGDKIEVVELETYWLVRLKRRWQK